MASAYPDVDVADVDAEIERLGRSIASVNRELASIPRPRHSERACDFERKPPKLSLFDERSDPPERDWAPRGEKPRRKEIEARRFNGKESVNEYLLQYELTARRNNWTDGEKAVNLLCALDGPARNILSEIEDVEYCTYGEVKQLLLKRFGPVSLSEVHEQTLQDLKLIKGQSIRELSSDAQRLAKLAYPEFDTAARTRMAIKALTDAVPDKEAVFYIKDKTPTSVDDVCTLYERYKVLHGEDDRKTRPAVRGLRDEPAVDTTALLQSVTSAIDKMVASTAAQLDKLSDAMTRLANRHAAPPVASPPVSIPQPSMMSAAAAPFQPSAPRPPAPDVPRKPCPRCKAPGHWAKDCPSQPPTDACFNCHQKGHRYRDCPQSLNANGPGPAPGARPFAPLH